jgi:hypothetical protein
MKSTPFDPDEHFPPIPFTQKICLSAKHLKEKGLKWTPHVGLFVWDQYDLISVPSPFPENIYFILNLGHFLKIFNSISEIRKQLVWIPTVTQSRLICDQLNIKTEKLEYRENAENDLLALYNLIELQLVQ